MCIISKKIVMKAARGVAMGSRYPVPSEPSKMAREYAESLTREDITGAFRVAWRDTDGGRHESKLDLR